MNTVIDRIAPSWSAPANVAAWTSTRVGGVSEAPWAGLNLATHVGDSDQNVSRNRQYLVEQWALPETPVWLQQVHGVNVVEINGSHNFSADPQADASFSHEPGRVCVVLTADCLPVFFCNRDGTAIAVAHAGWRGLADGVLEATVAALSVDPESLMAAFGPAIGFDAYEVGPEVVAELDIDRDDRRICKASSRQGHAYVNLAGIAAMRLQAMGLFVQAAEQHCTLSNSEQWFSHRRDGNTGRMASLIFMHGTTKL